MEGIDYQVLIVAPQTEPDKNRARIFVIEKVRREKDSRSGGPSAALVQVKLGVFVFQAILGGARRVFAYLHASMQTVSDSVRLRVQGKSERRKRKQG